MKEFQKKYNLEERTGKFGENIIRFCKNIKQDAITKPIIIKNLKLELDSKFKI